MKFIIEHLEPELFKWCEGEYKHISNIAGKENVTVANLKPKDHDRLKAFATVSEKTVEELKVKDAIVLDPSADKILSEQDCKTHPTLILGGILGEFPPKKRTKEHFKELPETWIRRNLGKEQMPTDTAALVAKMISEGTPFESIQFQDGVTLEIDEGEEVQYPFRYVVIKDEVVVSPEVLTLMKKGLDE